MSSEISLSRKDMAQVERALKGIKNGVQKAVSRALNRTATSMRGQSVKTVRESYTAKAGAIRKDIRIAKASQKNLAAEVGFEGSKLQLSEFSLSPKTDTTGAKRKAVKGEVRKGSPFTVSRGFVWGGKVFVRKTSRSLPVELRRGPAAAQMAGSENTLAALTETTQDTFDKRLDHEVEALLKGYSK